MRAAFHRSKGGKDGGFAGVELFGVNDHAVHLWGFGPS
jgi:hypothetical protein